MSEASGTVSALVTCLTLQPPICTSPAVLADVNQVGNLAESVITIFLVKKGTLGNFKRGFSFVSCRRYPSGHACRCRSRLEGLRRGVASVEGGTSAGNKSRRSDSLGPDGIVADTLLPAANFTLSVSPIADVRRLHSSARALDWTGTSCSAGCTAPAQLL